MHITFEINQSDYLNAARLAMRTRSKATSYLLYIFPVLAIYFGWMGLRTAVNSQNYTGLGSLAFTCLLLCLFPLFPNLLLLIQFRKNPIFKGAWSLEVSDDGVHAVASDVDSRTTWKVYSAFAENGGGFVLHQRGAPLALLIPKRELSASEINELRAIFASHLPRK